MARSGEEALDRLRNAPYDLIITDLRMPGMDGVELVRRLKTDHPDLAVVVMTAYGTIESAVEAMRLGAADYLVKPFEAAEVDGASGWQKFRYITYPLLTPYIFIALAVRSLDIARAYDAVRIMTDGGPAHRPQS